MPLDPSPASLPMYNADPAGVATFWHRIAAALRHRGIQDVPPEPAWPEDLPAHWLDPRLLLSQTCGFPLVASLAGRVQLVGAFRYAVEGCEGSRYSSHIVVRKDDPARTLEDCRDRIVAFNSSDSQSGYNGLLARIAPLAEDGRFFSQSIASGSHRRSLEWVRQGRADVAAIDAVSFAALSREGWVDVRTIGRTGLVPGLPLITSSATPPSRLAPLREALQEACADPQLAATRQALFIDGFETPPLADYDEILTLRRQAIALGCSRL